MFKPRLAAQKQFKKDNKIELEIEEPWTSVKLGCGNNHISLETFHSILGKLTFHPILGKITFHLILGKITFHPIRFHSIHVSPNTTFHPNYDSPNSCFAQFFHPIFFIPLTYIVHEFIAQIPTLTHKPLDRFASNFDWGNQENHGNLLRLVKNSNLSGSIHIYKQSWVPELDKYINAYCCKSATSVLKICNKVLMQVNCGRYTLRTHWNLSSLGGICKQE